MSASISHKLGSCIPFGHFDTMDSRAGGRCVQNGTREGRKTTIGGVYMINYVCMDTCNGYRN